MSPRRRGLVLLAILSLPMNTPSADADDSPAGGGYHRPGKYAHQSRSVVIARNGMVATSHPLAALAGLIILGFAMVALTWLGARIVERYRHRQPYHNPTPRPGEHDWAQKPLAGRATRTRSDPTGGELRDE